MNAYANYVVGHLLVQSWQIALLAGMVGLIAWALRNRSTHLRYLLWLIVLAKCLVPPFLTVPLAVLPEKSSSPSVAGVALPEEHSALEAPVPVGGAAQPQELKPAAPSTRGLVALVWTAGASLFLLWVGARAVRYTGWLRDRRRPLPPALQESIQELSMGFKFRKWPRIWLLEDICQPFVWGLLRGSVYLPAEFVRVSGSDRQRSILAHELSHIIRFDAGVNLLQVMAQAVYWFHPFVWWLNRKIRQEREKCCDEMAIVHLNTPPEHYTGAIVDVLAAERRSAHRIPSLAIVGSVKDIEERIKTMLTPGKKFHKRPSLVAASIALLTALVTIPTALVLTARGEGQPTAQSVDKPAADGQKPEQPRFAARTFNAQTSFVVLAQATPSSHWKIVGRTPSAAPLAIPACSCWWVQTAGPVKDWDLLLREITQDKVPGLELKLATDSDVKRLAGLTGLLRLGLGGTEVTDTGLGYLKDLTGLRLEWLGLTDTQITDAGLAQLESMTRLQRLDLPGTKITDGGLEHLKGLTQLQRLDLSGTRVAGAGLAHLEGLIRLQDLGLDNTQVTDMGLAHLQGLTRLRVVSLANTKIADSGLEYLKGLIELESLWLPGIQITDAGLAHLKGLTALVTLNLGGTRVTDAGLEHLKGLKALQQLYVPDTRVTDAGLEHLKGLTGLQQINLWGTQITDAGLEHLKGLTGLQLLWVSSKITDAGVQHLKGMTALQDLGLWNAQITDAGVASLKGLTGLQRLRLQNAQVTDTSLEYLKGLTGLQMLQLPSAQITDAGLVHLGSLTGLSILDLSGTRITDAGLEHLKTLTGLQQLWLTGTQVTDAGVQQLKQSLPMLTIKRDPAK